jgi:hypothetical protein
MAETKAAVSLEAGAASAAADAAPAAGARSEAEAVSPVEAVSQAEAQAETEAASDDGPQAFRFQVPPEFHAIPLGLGEDEDTFDEQMAQFARDYWGDAEELEPLRKLTKAMYSANAQELAASGAVYNALAVFPIGGSEDGSQLPERVSRATLTISVRDLDNPNANLAAAGIAEMLDKGKESGEAQLIALPAGPAVVHVAGQRAIWQLPEGKQERFFVRIEIWIPFPDEDDRLLLVCLSTADAQDLFLYQAVLADIADTIAFGEAEEPATAPQTHTFG